MAEDGFIALKRTARTHLRDHWLVSILYSLVIFIVQWYGMACSGCILHPAGGAPHSCASKNRLTAR